MLYTFIGSVCGGVATYIYCRIANINCDSHGYAPSSGSLLIMAGTILGAGIGAGIGISTLAQGTHIIQKLTKKLF